MLVLALELNLGVLRHLAFAIDLESRCTNDLEIRVGPESLQRGYFRGAGAADPPGLLEIELPAAVRQAVLQARAYETAAFETFPGLYASRRNYDVARGRTGDGHWRSGVLEQSWRCLLYTSPSPRDRQKSRMPSSA